MKTQLLPISAALLSRRMTATLAGLLAPGLALAGPTGGAVAAGSAAISAPDATHTVINQSSQNAIVNWQEFSVGSDEYVTFYQPNSSAAILNRVVGNDPSSILGSIKANGRVFLVNPNGIVFGQGATIDTGGLVATTMNIKNDDFMAGHYVMSGNSTAGVENQGTITASDRGFVVLAGDHVSNSGIITAKMGTVVLAAGSAITIDADSSGLVGFKVDEAALSDMAGVTNLGEIAAQEGTVIMTAKTAGDLARATVNNSGLIKAQGISQKGGDIYLIADGGSVTNSGTLDTSGHNGQKGGSVYIHADGNVQHAGTIDITGSTGGTAHLIAELALTTELGSTIDGRGSNGNGGFVELSGHQSFALNGTTRLGQGGTLLLDPSHLTICGGSYGDGSSCGGLGNNNTVYETAIEDSLAYGTNTYLIASQDITAYGNFTNGINDPTSSHSTADLLIGIGSPEGAYGNGSGFSFPGSGGLSDTGALSGFTRGTVSNSSYGSVDLRPGGSGAAIDISIGGQVQISSASNYGSIHAGNITSGQDILIQGADDVIVGNLTANNGADVSSAYGALTFGNINLGRNDFGGDIYAPSNGVHGSFFGSRGVTGGDITINNNGPYGGVDLYISAGKGNASVGVVDIASAYGTHIGNSDFSATSLTINPIGTSYGGGIAIENSYIRSDSFILNADYNGINIRNSTFSGANQNSERVLSDSTLPFPSFNPAPASATSSFIAHTSNGGDIYIYDSSISADTINLAANGPHADIYIGGSYLSGTNIGAHTGYGDITIGNRSTVVASEGLTLNAGEQITAGNYGDGYGGIYIGDQYPMGGFGTTTLIANTMQLSADNGGINIHNSQLHGPAVLVTDATPYAGAVYQYGGSLTLTTKNGGDIYIGTIGHGGGPTFPPPRTMDFDTIVVNSAGEFEVGLALSNDIINANRSFTATAVDDIYIYNNTTITSGGPLSLTSTAGDVTIANSSILGYGDVAISGYQGVDVNYSTIDAYAGNVSLSAPGFTDAGFSTFEINPTPLLVPASVSIQHSTISGNTIDVRAAGDVYVGYSDLNANNDININAANGRADLYESSLHAGGRTSGNISISGYQGVDVNYSTIDAYAGNVNLSALGVTDAGFTRLLTSTVPLQVPASISIQNSTISGNTIDVRAAGDVYIGYSYLRGDNSINVNAASGRVDLYESSLYASRTTGSITISGSQGVSAYSGYYSYDSTYNTLNADTVTISASGSYAGEGGPVGATVSLENTNISAGVLSIAAAGDITDNGNSNYIYVDGLSLVSGANILLGNSDTTVTGTRSVGTGSDPQMLFLLNQQAPDLVPSATSPQLAIVAPGSINVGSMRFDGSYLYVRAQTPVLNGNYVSPGEAQPDLFYNFVPYELSSDFTLTQDMQDYVNFTLNTTTFLIGSSTSTGNFNVAPPPVQEEALTFFRISEPSNLGRSGSEGDPSSNFVFLTYGDTTDEETIPTTGQVIVLRPENLMNEPNRANGHVIHDETDPGDFDISDPNIEYVDHDPLNGKSCS